MRGNQQLEHKTIVVDCRKCAEEFEVDLEVVVEHNDADVEVMEMTK